MVERKGCKSEVKVTQKGAAKINFIQTVTKTTSDALLSENSEPYHTYL